MSKLVKIKNPNVQEDLYHFLNTNPKNVEIVISDEYDGEENKEVYIMRVVDKNSQMYYKYGSMKEAVADLDELSEVMLKVRY